MMTSELRTVLRRWAITKVVRPCMSASIPVSYTHLDVYKRQVYASFALLTACVGIVLVGMLTEDYTLAYVVSNLSLIHICLELSRDR